MSLIILESEAQEINNPENVFQTEIELQEKIIPDEDHLIKVIEENNKNNENLLSCESSKQHELTPLIFSEQTCVLAELRTKFKIPLLEYIDYKFTLSLHNLLEIIQHKHLLIVKNERIITSSTYGEVSFIHMKEQYLEYWSLNQI